MRYQYILGVSVTERDEEYPELTDLPKTGEPAGLMLCGCWIGRFSLNAGMNFSSAAAGMCPVVRALGKRRVALRREFFPGKPWLGSGHD